MSAVTVTTAEVAPVAGWDLDHVLAKPGVGDGLDAVTARLAGLLDAGFLSEIGWDPRLRVLKVPTDHLLLGWRACRAGGCEGRGDGPEQICLGCRLRLERNALSLDELEQMPDPVPHRPELCRVPGCARMWRTAQLPLCRAHLYQQREVLKVPLEVFLTLPQVAPLPSCGPCGVAACERDRDGTTGAYCKAHLAAFTKARKKNPTLDEPLWRRTAPAIACPGLVSLRGLPGGLVVEILFGLQQRSVAGRRTNHKHLRPICDEMRRQQVGSLAEFVPTKTQRVLVTSFAVVQRRALSDPETEIAKDIWDMAVFGHRGLLTFDKITQMWLRDTAKRWAFEAVPRRRGPRIAGTVQAYINSLARLSESLRQRTDNGNVPSALGRSDLEAFLNRLAYQQSAGQITLRLRERVCRDLRQVFERVRALGVTRAGQAAAGLSDDFALLASDVPHPPEPGEPGRDLPEEIIGQLCAHLQNVTGRGARARMRVAVELLIDTGRRPSEIRSLPFDCLARDGDGAPVLVYDNHKANRLGRRLPISEATAELVRDQQRHVQTRHPHTPTGELKLLPSYNNNPEGKHGISTESLCGWHRCWLNTLPPLRTADGAELDKARITLYAYRHSYAQRHADAGVPVDVLRELMDHRVMDSTRSYYRVGEKRRREAVDRLTALHFDRHGNRVWGQAKALLDSEHTRRSLGEVAVPFGTCAEPSNVKAGGHACPFRFRCVGCDHFRTDVSYLPDLHAYLDDLLRNRERLHAATDLDDWARTEATPSDEEITRLRRLITRVKGDLDQLDATERHDIDHAIAVVRRHRTVTLDAPRLRRPVPDVRPQRPERSA